ncbi:ALF repeat-containing protein [Streptomyces sp. ST1020]|uniref:ALF repeat-containing protein n=1 Tax=Streptomyces sp. ST1020 TaxID=1848901 RepID=UPI0034C6966C
MPPDPGEPVGTDHIPGTPRGDVLRAWKTGGPGVRAAAEAALLGSDAQVRAFLDSERAVAELSDDRVATVQIFSAGGRASGRPPNAPWPGHPPTSTRSSRRAGGRRWSRTNGCAPRRSSARAAPR